MLSQSVRFAFCYGRSSGFVAIANDEYLASQ
jgi:hypothetical protein